MQNISVAPEKGNSKSDASGNCSAGKERSQLVLLQRVDEILPPDEGLEPGAPGYWSPENPDLVIPGQPAIAVYRNPFGQVVMRQEDFFGDDDSVIHISPENILSLIARLRSFQIGGAK
jgi:hypothetical protein